LSQYIKARKKVAPDAINFQQVKKVLVTKLRHHGDVLLSSPVFTALKNHYPHLEIDALIYQETHPMLNFHPAITEIFCIDKSWKKSGQLYSLKQEWELLKRLKARKYDLVIHLTESWRGAFLSKLLNPRFSVAGSYGHKRGKLWNRSFTHLYPTIHQRHTAETNLDAIRRLGLTPTENEKALTLVPGSEAEDRVEYILEKKNLLGKAFIVLHPTSRWLFKCWSTEKVSELINQLGEKGINIILTAAPDPKESEMIRVIKAGVQQEITDLSGQLGLKDLAALIGKAKCFVGVDTAPMHMAAAMQVPVVALFGPSSEVMWGPWQVRQEVITSSGYPCRPCYQDGCGGSKISDCLHSIPVQTVLDAIEKIIPDVGKK
jgi:heptosyltransferase-3